MDDLTLPYLLSTEKLIDILKQRQISLPKNIQRDEIIKIYNQFILPLPKRENVKVQGIEKCSANNRQNNSTQKISSTTTITINNNKTNKLKRNYPTSSCERDSIKRLTIDRNMELFDKKRPHLSTSPQDDHLPPTKHKKITYP